MSKTHIEGIEGEVIYIYNKKARYPCKVIFVTDSQRYIGFGNDKKTAYAAMVRNLKYSRKHE